LRPKLRKWKGTLAFDQLIAQINIEADRSKDAIVMMEFKVTITFQNMVFTSSHTIRVPQSQVNSAHLRKVLQLALEECPVPLHVIDLLDENVNLTLHKQ